MGGETYNSNDSSLEIPEGIIRTTRVLIHRGVSVLRDSPQQGGIDSSRQHGKRQQQQHKKNTECSEEFTQPAQGVVFTQTAQMLYSIEYGSRMIEMNSHCLAGP